MRRVALMPSRGGNTSPFGKLDDFLERQRIEGDIKRKLTARAASIGKPRAEVIRDFARVAALGPDTAARLYGVGVLKVVRLVVGKTDDNEISE